MPDRDAAKLPPYIDTGDRVIVKSGENGSNGFGGSNIGPEHVGKHGVVLSNDGWGHCVVLLDDGERLSCWNGLNLDREEA